MAFNFRAVADACEEFDELTGEIGDVRPIPLKTWTLDQWPRQTPELVSR